MKRRVVSSLNTRGAIRLCFVLAVSGTIVLYLKNIFGGKATFHQYDGTGHQSLNSATDNDGDNEIDKVNDLRIVLMWTPHFKLFVPKSKQVRSSCEYTNCYITLDRSYLPTADIVVFNLFRTELTDIPSVRPYGQAWVAREWEPPRPTTKLGLFSAMIDATANYRNDSDIHIPYGLYRELRKGELNEYDPNKNYASDQTKLVAWLVSHCGVANRRDEYVREMAKYLGNRFDIYGKCGTHSCESKAKCTEELAEYKFYLAFENSFCYQYITEKVWRTLSYTKKYTVPVVMGGGNYKQFLPPHSFIDVRQFRHPRELVNYLFYLDKNDTAYNEYFKWRQNYKIDYKHDECEYCAFANRIDSLDFSKRDQYKWWTEGSCTTSSKYYRGVFDALTDGPTVQGPNIDERRALPRERLG